MKRLLLHVGYPKSASTSLQNGLFLRLGKEKVVNFLGRAWESGFFGNRPNHKLYKDWYHDVVKGRPYDASQAIGTLSDVLPNLFSEGLSIMEERKNETIQMPPALHKHFAPQADKIDILLIIRNQPDLIQSYYVQGYRRFKQKLFADFLAHQMKEGWKGEGKVFNFHNVVSAYSAAFGKDNVHVLLFEDFVHRRELFCVQLAKALNIDPALILPYAGDDHLNKTIKEHGGIVIRKLYRKSLRSRAIRFLEKVSPSLAEPLRIRIPAASDAERKAIMECFRESNVRLAEEFSLDKPAMSKYGYF